MMIRDSGLLFLATLQKLSYRFG